MHVPQVGPTLGIPEVATNIIHISMIGRQLLKKFVTQMNSMLHFATIHDVKTNIFLTKLANFEESWMPIMNV